MRKYAFKEIEAALSQFHQDAKDGAFRGRLKNFQRLGLVPSSPGRGKRIDYDYEDACMWAFALQLGEYGIDPTAIKDVITFTWPAVYPLYQKGNHGQIEFFVMYPAAISGIKPWSHFRFNVGPAYRVIPNPENENWHRAIIIKITDNSIALRTVLGVDATIELPDSKFEENRVAVVKKTLKEFWPGAYQDEEA